MEINEIRPLEHDFTEVLNGIAVMPEILYYYGKLPQKGGGAGGAKGRSGRDEGGRVDLVFDREVKRRVGRVREDVEVGGKTRAGQSERLRRVAIVGARKNSEYGRKVAYQTAYELAKMGVVVISGLAYGIDSVAHRGALDAGGVTVGVLGTAIDRIYPTGHLRLAKEIVAKGGAVMSEYAPRDEQFFRAQFLARNRIIAGLSDLVIVVEAAEKSGSLNTAMHAINQGREVMAVPGDIDREGSVGCNRLIRQGAMPFTGVQDAVDVLFPGKTARQRVKRRGDNEIEEGVLKLIREGIDNGGEMIERLGIAVEVFNMTISLMEIKGMVMALGANRWGERG